MPPSPGLTFAAAKALTSLDHIQALQRVLALQVTSGPRSVRFKLSLALPGSPVFAVFRRLSSSPTSDFAQPPVAVGWGLIFTTMNFDSRLGGLDQGTRYRYRITVPTGTGNSIILTGEFFTSKREASVRIDELIMFSGGSDDFLGGDPDVTFFTAVYDAGTRERLVDQKIFGEFSESNGYWKVPFGKDYWVIPNAPDVIAPYMHLFEDDTGISFIDVNIVNVGRAVPKLLGQTGPFDYESDDGPFTGDSVEVVLPETPGDHTALFTLDTGPRTAHFKANGTIRTTVTTPQAALRLEGVARARTGLDRAIAPKSKQMKSALLPGLGLRLAVGDGHLMAHRPGRRELDTLPAWRVVGEADGDHMAVIAMDGSARVFIAGRIGGVHYGSMTARADHPEIEWQHQPGPPFDSLFAVTSGPDVHVLGIDTEGQLHHAALPEAGRGRARLSRWSRLGGPFVDVVAGGKGRGIVIFALSGDGTISRTRLNFPSGRARWSDLRSPKVTALSLHTGEDAITLLGVDPRARAQVQDFDFKGEPAGRGWTDLGPIDLFGADLSGSAETSRSNSGTSGNPGVNRKRRIPATS